MDFRFIGLFQQCSLPLPTHRFMNTTLCLHVAVQNAFSDMFNARTLETVNGTALNSRCSMYTTSVGFSETNPKKIPKVSHTIATDSDFPRLYCPSQGIKSEGLIAHSRKISTPLTVNLPQPHSVVGSNLNSTGFGRVGSGLSRLRQRLNYTSIRISILSSIELCQADIENFTVRHRDVIPNYQS